MNKFSQYGLNKFIHSILTTYSRADVELQLAPISGRTEDIRRSEQEMARPERFELPTAWFVARYSIQLSYGRT